MLPRKFTPHYLKEVVETVHEFTADAMQRVVDALGAERDTKRTRVVWDDEDQGWDEIYPPKARHIDKLEFDQNLLATKKSKKRLRTVPDDVDQEKSKEYYFKKKRIEMDDGGVELEAYSGAVCEFLAGKGTVAAVRPYYSYNGYVGVAAENLSNFKTNHSDPLRFEDTIISVMRGGQLRSGIDAAIHEICEILIDKNKNDMLAGLKRKVGALFEQQEMTPNYFHHLLQQFLSDEQRFTDAALLKLSSFIDARMDLIESKPEGLKQDDEMLFLSQLQSLVETYMRLEPDDRRDKLTVVDMEELDRYLVENHINMSQLASVSVTTVEGDIDVPARDVVNYRIVRNQAATLTARYILKEADCHNQNFSKEGVALDFGMTKYNISYYLTNQVVPAQLFKKPFDDTFKCTERDVRAFPFLRDASPFYWPTHQTRAYKILTKAAHDYLNRFQVDGNQDAVSKHITELVDAAVHEVVSYQEEHAPFLTKIAKGAYSVVMKIQATLANKSVDEYMTEQYRHELFAIAGGLVEKYLAEHHDELSRLEAEIDKVEMNVLQSNGRLASRFSEEDNHVFQSLASHPVFVFHKYKTLLKYILTDKTMYEAMAGLYISPQRTFNNTERYNGEYVMNVVADDEAERIYEISNVLCDMPGFRQFLEHDGGVAFDMLARELQSYARKYDIKALKKNDIDQPETSQPYERFSASLKCEDMNDRYDNILNACGVGRLSFRLGVE